MSTPGLNSYENKDVVTVGTNGELVLLGVSEWNGAISKLVGEARTYAKNYADGKHNTAIIHADQKHDDAVAHADTKHIEATWNATGHDQTHS